MRAHGLSERLRMSKAIFLLIEGENSMHKNELRRITVSAKRHSLYQLFWIALFLPIAIIVLIMSYIIYREDIPIKNLLEMLKRFMNWLKASD